MSNAHLKEFHKVSFFALVSKTSARLIPICKNYTNYRSFGRCGFCGVALADKARFGCVIALSYLLYTSAHTTVNYLILTSFKRLTKFRFLLKIFS